MLYSLIFLDFRRLIFSACPQLCDFPVQESAPEAVEPYLPAEHPDEMRTDGIIERNECSAEGRCSETSVAPQAEHPHFRAGCGTVDAGSDKAVRGAGRFFCSRCHVESVSADEGFCFTQKAHIGKPFAACKCKCANGSDFRRDFDMRMRKIIRVLPSSVPNGIMES